MTAIPPCPLIVEISPPPDPEDLSCGWPGFRTCSFLDSALRDPVLGRYSFLSADPWDYFQASPDDADSLGELARRMAAFHTSSLPGLPPFQGGAAGLLGYELGRQLEKLPAPAIDEFRLPAMAIGLYDVVAAFDHLERRLWIIRKGSPSGSRRRGCCGLGGDSGSSRTGSPRPPPSTPGSPGVENRRGRRG